MSQDTLSRLLSLPKFGSGIGLHRSRFLFEPLLDTDWGRGLDAIKVTGSNGKGGTAAMIAAILGALGRRTGLYTSPHLFRFNERVVVDGRPIPDPALETCAAWAFARAAEFSMDEQFCAFEIFTALGLKHFADEAVSALVAEVGVGGRFDPVRQLPGTVSVLTTVDLEHADILGSTPELIAYDKADLCQKDGVLAVGRLDPDLIGRLRAYCQLSGVTVVAMPEITEIHRITPEGAGSVADLSVDGLRLDGLFVPLAGAHQVDNAALAILAVRRWLRRRGEVVADESLADAIRQGLAGVTWPGRLQRVRDEPEVYIDLGHTPQAIAAIIAWAGTLRAQGREVLLVTGVSYNKKIEEIASALAGAADRVIATRAYHRGSDPAGIEAIVRRLCPEKFVARADTIEAAMTRALAEATPRTTILVAGGLFLSIEAWTALEGRDPQAIRFF